MLALSETLAGVAGWSPYLRLLYGTWDSSHLVAGLQVGAPYREGELGRICITISLWLSQGHDRASLLLLSTCWGSHKVSPQTEGTGNRVQVYTARFQRNRRSWNYCYVHFRKICSASGPSDTWSTPHANDLEILEANWRPPQVRAQVLAPGVVCTHLALASYCFSLLIFSPLHSHQLLSCSILCIFLNHCKYFFVGRRWKYKLTKMESPGKKSFLSTKLISTGRTRTRHSRIKSRQLLSIIRILTLTYIDSGWKPRGVIHLFKTVFWYLHWNSFDSSLVKYIKKQIHFIIILQFGNINLK